MQAYHRSQDLSDIEVAYVVSEQTSTETRPSKRLKSEPVTRFPAHKLCLRRNSSVLKTEIEAGAEVVQVLLESEADIPAADAMIAVMYSVPDALAGVEQQTLLRTALLANKYDAPTVLSTAVQKLSAQDALDAATLDLVWQLPGCWEQPFWPLLQQAIQHKLSSTDDKKADAVTELLLYMCDRDLEMVWTDSSSFRRELLMQLPVGVLTAFLQSEELRVVSEDTVLYTIAKRVENMQQIRPRVESTVIQQAQQQLMSAVRMPQLTPSALTFVAPNLPWISQKQCNIASFMKQCSLSEHACAGYGAPAHWLLLQRNKSPKASHTMEFEVKLSDFQTRCSDLLGLEVGATRVLPAESSCRDGNSFGGRRWHFRWEFLRVDSGVATGWFLGPDFPCMAGAINNIAWLPAGAKTRVGSYNYSLVTTAYSKTGLGKSGFMILSSADAWAAPAWADGDRVVAHVSVLAHNCL